MKRIIIVLMALLVPFWASILAKPSSTPVASAERLLMIERSASPVAGGKALLTISPLNRVTNIYAGDYDMKVSPYFFKSEKGKLAIEVTPESLDKVRRGMPAEITGLATSEDGESRRIDAVATPLDPDRGALKLWFLAGERKMVFNTSYRFVTP
jgi:hypothetical protein